MQRERGAAMLYLAALTLPPCQRRHLCTSGGQTGIPPAEISVRFGSDPANIFSLLIYFFFKYLCCFVCLKGTVSERKRDRIFHALVLSPSSHNGQNWAAQEPGASSAYFLPPLLTTPHQFASPGPAPWLAWMWGSVERVGCISSGKGADRGS